ncbi:MAG: DotA/TraY family protein, partial [Alphaproteobacteria bacterium]
AQLSSVGKSMVDRSIAAFAAAGIFTVGSIIPNPFAGAADSFASFFGTIGSIGLLVGFILFYVLPFMPFLYFFFSVGDWIKGIFEAMVAMPLWALAHLRIDGDGIPGEAAIGGYYLIFEIFIRPILIVFGLLAAITIFAAMVRVLNDIFYLAITNLSGHDAQTATTCFTGGNVPYSTTTTAIKQGELAQSYRGPVDEFFFTVLYTIIVYMTATSSFKLIDMIPDNMLRWINAEVPSFGDNAGDAAEGLMKYVTLGGSQFGSQLGESLGGFKKGLQGSVQSFMKDG